MEEMAEFLLPGVPPGFRFHPTDVELVHCYLEKQVHGQTLPITIPTLDVYGTAPWDLPPALRGADGYLFCLAQRTQCTKNGKRVRRTLGSSGTWRGNKTQEIVTGGRVVGYKTFLTLQADKKGSTTGWIMHEYRLANRKDPSEFQGLVLCKIKKGKQEGSAPGKRQKVMEPDEGALNDVGECSASVTYDDTNRIDPVPMEYPIVDGPANDAVLDMPLSATFPLHVQRASPCYAPYTGDMGEGSSATPLAVDALWQDVWDEMAPRTVMASAANVLDGGSVTPRPRPLPCAPLDDTAWLDEPIQTWFTCDQLLSGGENPDAGASSQSKDYLEFQLDPALCKIKNWEQEQGSAGADLCAPTSFNNNGMNPMGSLQTSAPAAPLPHRPMMAAHHGTDGAPNELAADVPADTVRTESDPLQVLAAPSCCASTWHGDGLIWDGSTASVAETAAMDWASILRLLTDGAPTNEIFRALMREGGSATSMPAGGHAHGSPSKEMAAAPSSMPDDGVLCFGVQPCMQRGSDMVLRDGGAAGRWGFH